MTRYYDAVLVLIPAALIGISAVLVAFGFSFSQAVPVASIVSFALMGHAMFLNAPSVGQEQSTVTRSQRRNGPLAD